MARWTRAEAGAASGDRSRSPEKEDRGLSALGCGHIVPVLLPAITATVGIVWLFLENKAAHYIAFKAVPFLAVLDYMLIRAYRGINAHKIS